MMDTLSIARNLSEAGVDWKQAQAHAAVIARAVEQQHGDVATKEFVRSELNALRGELSSEISTVEARLLRWMVGLIFTAISIVIAAQILIP